MITRWPAAAKAEAGRRHKVPAPTSPCIRTSGRPAPTSRYARRTPSRPAKYDSTSGTLSNGPRPRRPQEVGVEPADRGERDTLRAHRRALPGVRTAAEAGLVLRGQHGEHPPCPLGLALREPPEMGDLGRGEQHRRTVRAGGHARAAADAGGRLERRVRV